MVGAFLVALSSAAFFAVGSSLQHRSAGSAPKSSKRRMVLTLARRPGWLLGAGLGAVAFALHATALKLGDLSLVQPIILSGIVFTVFARSALDRRLPSRGEIAWVALTWAGLALFISMLRPGDPHRPDKTEALIMVGIGLAVVAVLALVARRSHAHPLARGILLGCGSGILFGLVAGLLKLSTIEAGQGVLHLLAQWPPWVLVVAGGCAVLLNQRAYQSTRLSVSAPVLNICQLMVSMTFALMIFQERLLSSPATIAAELVGLAIMAFGVTKLASLAAGHPGTEPENTSSPDTEPQDKEPQESERANTEPEDTAPETGAGRGLRNQPTASPGRSPNRPS